MAWVPIGGNVLFFGWVIWYAIWVLISVVSTAPIKGVSVGLPKSIEREGEVTLRRVGTLRSRVELLAEPKCNHCNLHLTPNPKQALPQSS